MYGNRLGVLDSGSIDVKGARKFAFEDNEVAMASADAIVTLNAIENKITGNRVG